MDSLRALCGSARPMDLWCNYFIGAVQGGVRVELREFLMKNNSSKSDNTTPINIDDRLYDLLRKFCDKEGRRLKEFVEDALENAVYTEESIKVLTEEIKILKRKEAKYDYAFRRGFQKGFYISFCALHGQILVEPDDEAFEILKNDPYRISKGTQLDLFR
jgi:hypothetical protein